MGSTLELLRRLVTERVDFVLVGGMAAVAHGSAEVTENVDVCIRFDEATLRGLFRAVDGLHPRQRMHPARPPLGEDPLALLGYRNLYLVTDAGILDLLGEIPGVGGLEHLKARSVSLRVADFDVPVIGLEDLVLAKRAVARPKDLRVARELERVLARKAKT